MKHREETPLFVINDDPAAQAYLSELGVTDVKIRKEVNSLRGLGALSGDVAIVDSYRLPLTAYEALSTRFNLLAAIDDENRLPYPKSLVINGALYAESLPYPKQSGMTYLLGPAYFLLKPDYANLPEHPIRETVKDILITAGGADAYHLTEKLLRSAGKIPDVTLHILTTDGFEGLEEIYETAGNLPAAVRFYHNKSRLVDLMLSCDLALSAGGQTTYELAACGTPTIGVCTAQNQLLNLQAWAEAGFLLFAGWENDPEVEGKLEKYLEAVAPEKTRKKMSEQGKLRIDGKGAQHVAEALLEYGNRAVKLKKAGAL